MRILFACDVQNLYYSAKEQLGADRRLSFLRFRREVSKRYPAPVRAVAYVALSDDTIGRVVHSLRKAGFEVPYRRSKHRGNGHLAGTDMDTRILVDIIEQLSTFDVFLMASGDGDFIPLYEHLRKNGKRVEVYAFEKSFNRDIYASVDDVHFIDVSLTFKIAELGGDRHAVFSVPGE